MPSPAAASRPIAGDMVLGHGYGGLVSATLYGASPDASAETNTQAILDAIDSVEGAVTIYIQGRLEIEGDIEIEGKIVTFIGDGPQHSALVQTTSGGIVFDGGTIDTEVDLPVLNMKDMAMIAGAEDCGIAVSISYTGGSGYAPRGGLIQNVHFLCDGEDDHYWTKHVYGLRPRYYWFVDTDHSGYRRQLRGYTTHGFHFEGNGDPIELYFRGQTFRSIEFTLIAEGGYEGINIKEFTAVNCYAGPKHKPTSVKPLMKITDAFMNVANIGVEVDNVAWLTCANVDVLYGTVEGDADGGGEGVTAVDDCDFIGLKAQRSGGAFVDAARISGLRVSGGKGASAPNAWSAQTHIGVQIVDGGWVDVDLIASYCDTGVEVQDSDGGFNGIMIRPTSMFPGTTTPIDCAPGLRRVHHPQVYGAAYMSADKTDIDSATWTKLPFNTLVSYTDPEGQFDTSTNTVTLGPGTYVLSAGAWFSTNVVAGQKAGIAIYLDGVLAYESAANVAAVNGSHFTSVVRQVTLLTTTAVSIHGFVTTAGSDAKCEGDGNGTYFEWRSAA